MLYQDVITAQDLSGHLTRFHSTGKDQFAFRCPYCGDSEKNKNKTRGNLFPSSEGDGLIMHCYNCGITVPFGKFLEYIDYELFRNWKFATFGSKKKAPVYVVPSSGGTVNGPVSLFDDLAVCSDLHLDHPAIRYLVSRHVPETRWDDLYYVENFAPWANARMGKAATQLIEYMEEPRIIIPLKSDSGIEFGFQGRYIGSSDHFIRYVTKMIDERFAKFWGMHLIDRQRPFAVLEGVFDAFLFPNAGAALDGDLAGKCEALRLPKDNAVLIFDNELNNRHVKKQIMRAIDLGYKVAIWPKWTKQHGKDVSALVKEGYSDIPDVLMSSAQSGLLAQLQLTQGSK